MRTFGGDSKRWNRVISEEKTEVESIDPDHFFRPLLSSMLRQLALLFPHKRQRPVALKHFQNFKAAIPWIKQRRR